MLFTVIRTKWSF